MSTIQQSYPRVLDAVQALRQRWRTGRVVEGVLLAVAGSVAALVALVALDNLATVVGWPLGTLGRVASALVLWGVVLAGAFSWVVKRCLEDRRDDYFAALAEEKYPELGNRFINALQLGRGNQDGHSPRLIEAIVSGAAERIDDLELDKSVDRKPLLHAAIAGGVALLVLLGYSAVFNERFLNGAARLLLPLSDIPPYTASRVKDVKPGEVKKHPEGVPLEVTARVVGVVPEVVSVARQSGNGPWVVTEMEALAVKDGEPAGYKATLPAATEPYSYKILAGDGFSPTYRVNVLPRPVVEAVTVRYERPAYTGSGPREVTDASGEVADVAGTRVTVTVKSTKPVASAKLIAEGGAKVFEMAADKADPRLARATFTLHGKERGTEPANADDPSVVVAPTRYQVELQDTDGYADTDDAARRLWRTVSVTADRAPSVALTSPAKDLLVPPGTKVPVAVTAVDDFGVGEVKLWAQRDGQTEQKTLAAFTHAGELQTKDAFEWDLKDYKAGDRLVLWATAVDRKEPANLGESRKFRVQVVKPEDVADNVEVKITDYTEALERLIRAQRTNRAETESGVEFAALVKRQSGVRKGAGDLARTLEESGLPLDTMVQELDALVTGHLADAVKLLESGLGAATPDQAKEFRAASQPVQDKVIEALEQMLARLKRNEKIKKTLEKMTKDKPDVAKEIVKVKNELIKQYDLQIRDATKTAAGFEKLPKNLKDITDADKAKLAKDLEDFAKRTKEWTKDTVNEMAKLPPGLVDDFGMKKDVHTVFEEVEKKAKGASAELPVAVEDLGVGLATKMKEDLEMWLPDAADAVKWNQEEPNQNKPSKVPEMPLPKDLTDLIGDLLQKAEEFDEEADDITSAWGDNLDQNGWGVSDGPISTFSAKGKTGNDLPNNHEVTGRSGDGRRGKSTGQMVGDTSKGLEGRKTPARVGNERYEPGKLKEEGKQDPNGATGGGKKAGSGRKGLQGGTPPDPSKDMGRLSEKEAGLQEKAEQVAKKLETYGIKSTKLADGMKLIGEANALLKDGRYEEAARKRKEALSVLNAAAAEADQSTARSIKAGRDLSPELRQDLLQSADDAYPPGYEELLKKYYKSLSQTEK